MNTRSPESAVPGQSAMKAIRNRGRSRSNIWIFHSPKIDRRLIIPSDVAFVHLVLAEGNPEISSYTIESPTRFADINNEKRKTTFDVTMHFGDRHDEWWEFKWSRDAGPARQGHSADQLTAKTQAAHEAGVPYKIITERDFKDRELLFDNWLVLCGVMNRARHGAFHEEARVLQERLDMHRAVTLNSLMTEPKTDPALMFAAVARGLQRGLLKAELEKQFLCATSVISRRTQ